MKAAIYYGPRDIRVEEIARPLAGREGVILRVKACGVCNILDMDAWLRRTPSGIGVARGHEWSGEVVEVGPEVTGVDIGDRVFVEPVYKPCYSCGPCRTKEYLRCPNWRQGELGTAIHGGFAEYLWIPFVSQDNVIKLPSNLSYHDLALMEPLGVGVGLAKKAKAGDVVTVLGQDLVGLATVAVLKDRGASKVVAVDVSNKRLAASSELGADVVINSLEQDPVAAVMKETWGEGVDVVILVDPRPIALSQAVAMVRPAGAVWLATSYETPLTLVPSLPASEGTLRRWAMAFYAMGEPPIAVDPALFNIQTAWGTLGSRISRWEEAVKLITSGRITAEKFVTHVFPLERASEAFRVAANPHESVKVLIEP